MQFRKVTDTNKVQCLVAHYDTETKRTRQKLLCTLDMSTSLLSGAYMSKFFAFGSLDEKNTYISEIDTYVAQYRLDNASQIAQSASFDIGMRSHDLIELLNKSPNSLSANDRESLADALESLLFQLRTTK